MNITTFCLRCGQRFAAEINSTTKWRYKKCPECRAYIHEINPRPTGTVRLNKCRRLMRMNSIYNEGLTTADEQTALRAQNYCDFYTDEPLGDSPSKDHILPISKGGPHTLDNIVFVTQPTNASKNAKPYWLFIEHLVKEGRITPEAAKRKLSYLNDRMLNSDVASHQATWIARTQIAPDSPF